jgi:tetratricopeptide (TPR) repeat protein
MLWSGHYEQAEHRIRESVSIARQSEWQEFLAESLKNLGLVMGYQGKYLESHSAILEAISIYTDLGNLYEGGVAMAKGFMGCSQVLQGKFDEAKVNLQLSLSVKERLSDGIGIPELLNWLGLCEETRANCLNGDAKGRALEEAISFYEKTLSYRWTNRLYFICGALTALARLHCRLGNFTEVTGLIDEASSLARRYEYNDHLASLYLTEARLLESKGIANDMQVFDAALHKYRQALVHALRYNRYLLDEVIDGRPCETPFIPIVQHCSEMGEMGQRMIGELLEWWRTGRVEVSCNCSNSISPIPEGMLLVPAEQLARELEPDNQLLQRSIEEQLKAALA